MRRQRIDKARGAAPATLGSGPAGRNGATKETVFSAPIPLPRDPDGAPAMRWDFTPADKALAGMCVTRWLALLPQVHALAASQGKTLDFKAPDPFTCTMDLLAVHCNHSPLELGELLRCETVDFIFDMLGLARWIDRSSGRLGGGFRMRCARKGVA